MPFIHRSLSRGPSTFPGRQGVAPGDGCDPLAEWVRPLMPEQRELHAWFNPIERAMPARNHPGSATCCEYPSADRETYGDMLWMDPGEEQAATRTLAVIAECGAAHDMTVVHTTTTLSSSRSGNG